MPRQLTLIYPYYDNPVMLKAQLEHLSGLPAEVRELLHLIVVDDGSPTFPLSGYTWPTETTNAMIGSAILPTNWGLASFKRFRIMVDVRWNWIAARNLAMDKATTEWRLMTDIDHMVPLQTLARIMFGGLETTNAYRFSRVDAPNMTPYKPHPNSWLLTGKRFAQAGGYDERFSGFYGSDGEWRDRLTAVSREVVLLPEPLIRYPREVIADASTTTYERKQAIDRDGVTRVRALIKADPKPHRLTFPWEALP